jgi:type IV pilus assembly protein PilP
MSVKNVFVKLLGLSLGAILLSGLSGCSSDFDVMKARMDAIRAKPRGRVEAPPEFTPMPTFTYAAHQLRSPFFRHQLWKSF